jgi:hypothetical protein
MNDWTGEPIRTLDELAAFDAMRRFLETWWEVGGRSEDNIATILGSTNRTNGASSSAPQGPPIDMALWDDWRDAVTKVLSKGSAPDRDPLA